MILYIFPSCPGFISTVYSVHVKSISHSHFFLLDKSNLHKHTTAEAAKDADETHSFLLGPISPGAHIINYS